MFDSKYTGQQIEEMLEQAGNDLVTAGEDESYVVKVVDAEGTVLAGFKESGEIAVPIGLTDDAYTLIYALYEKLGIVFPALQDWVNRNFTTTEDLRQLIANSADDDYVMKLVDAANNLLIGFKLSGEIDAPNGITDGAYDINYAIYNKLTEVASSIKDIRDRVSKLEQNN